MIKILDDVCSEETNLKFYQFFINQSFKYGETDSSELPPTGMVIDLDINSSVYIDLLTLLNNNNIFFDKLSRCYVNLFLPHERPFFHYDGNVTTCLFYFNPLYEKQEGGETQFIVNEEIFGVFPKPGRLVLFDGNILHRATSFRTKPRITVALKFFK